MDSSDNDQEGFSMFSKKARIEKTSTGNEQTGEKVLPKNLNVRSVEDRLTFADLGLNEWVVKCVNSMQITRPTPVQKYCIPEVLAGKNVTGVSETGSGKTAVFALPILQRLSTDPYGIFAVVLTPTRELAIQIDDQMQAFGAPIHVRTTLIIGGQPFVKQAEALRKRPHVVIATPGRFLQHLKTADPPVTKRLGFIVLDECDRMLSDSLKSEVSEIVSLLKSRCVTHPQFLFLTATYDASIRSELKSMDITPDYEYIPEASKQTNTTVDSLDEFYLLTPDHVKLAYFIYFMIHSMNPRDDVEESEEDAKKRLLHKASAIVFCNTCRMVQLLSEMLRVFQIENVPLHSLLSQGQRDAALAKFRNNRISVLVCTDVASRGLDIPQVDLVANYDLPKDPFDYIHRVGRTARAGRAGTAVSFVTLPSVAKLQAIEAVTGKRCREFEGVEEESVLKILNRVGRSLRVAKQFMVENGLEAKIEERRRKKRERRENGETGEAGETEEKKERKERKVKKEGSKGAKKSSTETNES